MIEMVVMFRKEYAFLSNFYEHPFMMEGYEFQTAEHAYQAAKTLNVEEAIDIRDASNPKAAKYLGARCTLRPNWNNMRIPVMQYVIDCKFADPELATMLLNTGDKILQEGNTWNDRFWGTDLVSGVGDNWLGKILMLKRQTLKEKL